MSDTKSKLLNKTYLPTRQNTRELSIPYSLKGRQVINLCKNVDSQSDYVELGQFALSISSLALTLINSEQNNCTSIPGKRQKAVWCLTD